MSDDKKKTFMKLFLANESMITGYLLACTGNLSEAEELFQEVSLVLWGKFETYDQSRPFKSWALGIARLEILKWRQAKTRSKESLSAEAVEKLADTAVQTSGEIDTLHTYLAYCLEKIQNTVKQVVEMKYKDSFSIADIAEYIGKKVGAVEMILVRARRFLRKCIEKKKIEEERALS